MRQRPLKIRPPRADYELELIGHRRTPLSDFYHTLLLLPWSLTFACIVAVYLGANALFAVGYLLTGGLAHARPGSFWDAFFFSVQTMGTIGYGALFPEGLGAHLLVVGESIVGLSLTAMTTGLLFAKLSRPRARVVFSRYAVLCPMNGVPTLMFRLGNERSNQIVDAQIRVAVARTEVTKEGERFYRMTDLPLARERVQSLSRSFSVLHPLGPQSPLAGYTPERMAAEELELDVQVVGMDDISMQPVHAAHRYFAREILWGARLVDVLSVTPEGNMRVDLRHFHETEPSAPMDDFPYPRPREATAGASFSTNEPPA